MATAEKTQTPPPRVRGPRDDDRGVGSWAWPVGLLSAAAFMFILYQWILPNADASVQTWFREWLSPSAVNECVLWAVFALGLNVVVGYAGLLDLGYVAFWAIGGYTAGWLFSTFAFDHPDKINIHILGSVPPTFHGIHINFWLVLLISGGVCALSGVIIGAPTLRLKSDYLALVTLGFGEIIPQIFTNGDDIFGQNISNGTKGITPVDPIQLYPGGKKLLAFDLSFKFLIFVGMAAFICFVSLRLREGRLGRAWLAIREDELAASMMGVPLMRTKLAAYAVGAFAGGLGGVAFATHVGGVLPDRFNFTISITLLAMVVLGGMGNVWGVIVGALILSWINNTGLAQFGDTFNNTFHTSINFPAQNFLLFGSILVLMMLFRREGLIPETRTKRLLKEPERTQLESVGADLEGEVRG